MPRVTLSGDISGDYLVVEQRPDGTLLLAPESSLEALRRRDGLRRLTPQEFEAFFTEYGKHMLPPDDEG